MTALRNLPSVDSVLTATSALPLIEKYGHLAVRATVRAVQAEARKNPEKISDWLVDPEGYAQALAAQLSHTTYEPVFNLTGTVIHTNLGRALLSANLWNKVEPLVTRPVNLEFDIHAGKRGDRDQIIEARLKRLTGCEAATVVNNNAAALVLVLNTLAMNQKVPVSRGELIEIGGSFRLPELMARSGCTLVEVGTTNRTHLKDYEAVAEEAALLLKVHPSNYHVSGFTKEVSAEEIARLGKRFTTPSCVDIGSGTLVNLSQWGLPEEPTPQSVLEQGVDLVTFSGDKLLGGVQAGIIVGRTDLVEQIKRNPLKRALRADKITLTILEETLKLYEQPERLAETIPVLHTLTLAPSELTRRAERIQSALPESWTTFIEDCNGQIGSGALPDKHLPSVALVVRDPQRSPAKLLKALRGLSTPVVARIAEDRVWLDMRGADPLDELILTLSELS